MRSPGPKRPEGRLISMVSVSNTIGWPVPELHILLQRFLQKIDRFSTGKLTQSILLLVLQEGHDTLRHRRKPGGQAAATQEWSGSAHDAFAAGLPAERNHFVPAFTAAQAWPMITQFANVTRPAFNGPITDVPGSQMARYSLRTKMDAMIVRPYYQWMAWGMPISSCCGQPVIGLYSCRVY